MARAHTALILARKIARQLKDHMARGTSCEPTAIPDSETLPSGEPQYSFIIADKEGFLHRVTVSRYN